MERKLKLKKPDTRSIDIDDEYALDYWARELNVSQAKLRSAISIAGSLAGDVKRELKKVV